MKRILSLFLCLTTILILAIPVPAAAPAPDTSAPSVVLMDADTGTILTQKTKIQSGRWPASQKS